MVGTTAASAWAASGDIQNLGTLPGGNGSIAYDINDAGIVAGGSGFSTASLTHAVVWSSGTGLKDLGTLPTFFPSLTQSLAFGINSAGTIVGRSGGEPTGGVSTAANPILLPSGGATLQDLNPDPYSRSEARSINDAGDVVGFFKSTSNSSLPQTAFIRRASDDVFQKLQLPANVTTCTAYGINSNRDVVGTMFTSANQSVAFLWHDDASGVFHDLGTLGSGSNLNAASAINDAGVVVGSTNTPTVAERAFKRGPNDATMVDLGGFYDTGSSDADDINAVGAIVGRARTADGAYHATLWDLRGNLIDLDAWLDAVNPTAGAPWTLIEARAINNTGLVAGSAIYDDGPAGLPDGTRGFVLDVSSLLSPEPTCALMLAPLLPLLRRRR